MITQEVNWSPFRSKKEERRKYFLEQVYGRKLRPCSACNGSGRYDNVGSPKCSVCNGTGKERDEGICFKCQHRADSMLCALDWRARGAKGICADPSPKAECKRHSGYGKIDETRAACRDFKPLLGRWLSK